jgi:hypothetical protein
MNQLRAKIAISASVLHVLSLISCPECLQSGSSALSATNGLEIAAPDLAVLACTLVGTAVVMMLMD